LTDGLSAGTLLAGRTAIVTGTSRGIGRALALGIAAAGANVLAVSRAEPASEVAERIQPFRCDVCAPDAPDIILDAALAAFGRVDTLVNNAGIIRFATPMQQTDEEWDDTIATNLTAPFRLSQRLANHWVSEQQPGVIVNLCSVESDVAFHDQPAYAASKGGLLGLTRAMALELAPLGIRVLAIGPGVIDTGMTPPRPEDLERIPMHRLGTPEEVADGVVLLLSPLARYATGSIFYLDGGYLTQ
jgi:NAD(P)-dependent dehydrogenase (short-subunit alcohol dehydrogenase family)